MDDPVSILSAVYDGSYFSTTQAPVSEPTTPLAAPLEPTTPVPQPLEPRTPTSPARTSTNMLLPGAGTAAAAVHGSQLTDSLLTERPPPAASGPGAQELQTLPPLLQAVMWGLLSLIFLLSAFYRQEEVHPFAGTVQEVWMLIDIAVISVILFLLFLLLWFVWEVRAHVCLLLWQSCSCCCMVSLFLFTWYIMKPLLDYLLDYLLRDSSIFLSYFWLWLTWPVQLLMSLLGGQFCLKERSIKAAWRPILWGMAQFLKIALPVLRSDHFRFALRSCTFLQQQPIQSFCRAVRFVTLLVCFMLFMPVFHVVPWIYTCPFAQLWLVYMIECGKGLYCWRASGGSCEPEHFGHMWVCAACVVVYLGISICTPKFSEMDQFIVDVFVMLWEGDLEKLKDDKLMADIMQKGGFKAKLEQWRRDENSPTAGLIRRASSIIFPQDAVSIEIKRRALKMDCLARHGCVPFVMLGPVERSNLLKSSLEELQKASISQLLSPSFHISFKGEAGLDAGGLTRDWYNSVAMALVTGARDEGTIVEVMHSSLLAQATDQTLLPRPSGYTEQKLHKGNKLEMHAEAQAAPAAIKQHWYDLAMVGRFVAVAVLQEHPLPISFGNILMKFLCDQTITYRDMLDLDPDFFKYRVEMLLGEGGVQTMNAVLDEPLSFVAAATEFVREPEPLIPGGERNRVTEENKMDYIHKLCEARLCNGRRRELMFFIEGFHKVISLESIQKARLTPRELSVLISGVEIYDVATWKASAQYRPEQVAAWFWEVLESFDEEEKAKVLQFTTGSSRLPIGGFPTLRPKFKVIVSGADIRFLPISHTCANQIDLPRYTSKNVLKDKLRTAISDTSGFGFA